MTIISEPILKEIMGILTIITIYLSYKTPWAQEETNSTLLERWKLIKENLFWVLCFLLIWY